MANRNCLIPIVTRNQGKVKLAQAEKFVSECRCAWVNDLDHLQGIRDLSRKEQALAIDAKFNEQRRIEQLHGGLEPINPTDGDIKEVMPRSDVWTPQAKYEALVAAREFYTEAVG